jgi:hypothetical protein
MRFVHLLGFGALCVACSLTFAACDSSGDTATGGTLDPNGTGGSPFGFDGGGGTGAHGFHTTPKEASTEDACHRDVGLTAVTLGDAEPFDLVIVADHSQSLAWSRDELSNGLRTLLEDVKGRSVRVFVLTPTQYGASSAAAQMPLSGDPVVAWQDPATGKPYTNEMTTYTESCTDPTSGATITCPDSKGPTPYDKKGSWQFKMPAPIAVLTPDMTDAEFTAEEQSVSTAILAIGGTGSPQEQPLCTLSRYVSQNPASLPKNVVFLVISDEDDVSTPAQCLAGFKADLEVTKTEASSSPCSSNCTTYRYTMTGDAPWKAMSIHCSAFDDTGKPIPGTDKQNYVNQMAPGGCTPGVCTADESTLAAPFCDKGLTLVSCDRTCSTNQTECSVDLANGAINACTQAFTTGGASYANLSAYCAARGGGTGWRNCSGGGLNIQYTESTTGGFSPDRLMFGTTTADVAAYFKSKADSAFTNGKYLVEAIVFDAAFSCQLGAGQSYATNIAALIGDRTRLFPLCQPYAPALDGVLGFAKTLVQTQFTVTLKSDEQITAVHVVDKDGAERVLSSSQFNYDEATHTLTIDKASLGAADRTLRVEVTSDCRPIR